MRTTWGDQTGSSTRRDLSLRLETSPAGNVRIHPPARRCERMRRVPATFPGSDASGLKGLTSMSHGRMPGIWLSQRLPTTKVSGRARSRKSMATSPSASPCGWFATTTNGPERGMRARHWSLQVLLSPACSIADVKKSGRPAAWIRARKASKARTLKNRSSAGSAQASGPRLAFRTSVLLGLGTLCGDICGDDATDVRKDGGEPVTMWCQPAANPKNSRALRVATSATSSAGRPSSSAALAQISGR